ncbi:MAG: SDR family oxidoreductase [Anaerolineales bacterium]|nr:SDR family oxidoreductase [Anaerolineales bacterium]
MKLLILGGTRFLGRHLVEAALARGHEITLFNRGQSNPDLFPEVETLLGDRDGGLDALAGRRWDAVIDTCGYLPRLVRASARALAETAAHYTFISSISVYADATLLGMDENAAVGVLADESVEEITHETYGPLKALCEREVQAAFPQGALIIRPGLIVGPHDPTDRLTYWVARLARGGQVLAPGDPDMPVQIIDARDLAEWNIRLVDGQVTGVFNATGPEQPLTMQAVITACRQAVGAPAEITWVSEEFLLEQQVTPFTEIPLWLPREVWGMLQVDISRALDAGLTFRPLSEIVADTLAWDRTLPTDRTWVNGLKPERETELLAAWREQQK